MGRKERREREQKRESYAAKHTAEKRKHMLIAAGVLGAVVAIVGWAALEFVELSQNPEQIGGAPFGAGMLGSAHTHTAILVKIFGDTFPFQEAGYQLQSSWIHFENHDGSTVHKHATGVTMEYLFDSLDIALTDQCYVFPNGQEFCTNEDYTLRFFINGAQVNDIRDYEPMEDDRVLIVYGDESPEDIAELLAELDRQELVR